MNSRNVFITYFVLSIILIASAALFAYEIKFLMQDRKKDPLEPYKEIVINEEQAKSNLEKEERLERMETIRTYTITKSFAPLATRIPTPTPLPKPSPSPTPVVPAKNYKISFATANMVTLIGYDGKNHFVKVGDKVEEPQWGDFEILQIYPDMQNPRVKVKHIQSGTVRVFDKEGNTVN